MDQAAAKPKQGGEETEKTDKGTKSAQKSKSNDAHQLVEFMMEHYKEKVESVTSFDDFYHAIYELIEMFCRDPKRGQLQYKMPTKQDLKDQYEKYHRGKQNLKFDEFEKIAKGVFKLESFTFGKAAVHVLAVLFGVPVCALLAKRFVPGIRSLSDDIVIPAATSGAVVYLAKTKKL